MVIEGHDAKQEALPVKHQVVYAIASMCHGDTQSLQPSRNPLPLKFRLLCDPEENNIVSPPKKLSGTQPLRRHLQCLSLLSSKPSPVCMALC